MMKDLLLWIIIALVLLVVFHNFGPVPIFGPEHSAVPQIESQQQWVTFSSLKGDFSVSMPGEPSEMKHAGPSGLISHVYTSATGHFQVGYSDLPESILQDKGPEKILEEYRDTALESMGGNLTKESAVSLDGNPGREFAIAAAGLLSK